MILQALNDYYGRMINDPESGIPLPGYSIQKIHFAIVLDKNGNLVEIKDIRNYEGKRPQPIELSVPEAVIRSGKPTPESAKPNFLWDNTGYVLGVDNKGKEKNALITFNAFRNFHHALGDSSNDTGMQAVLHFLDSWDQKKISMITNWQDVIDANANLVFLIDGENQFVHQSEAIQNLWEKFNRSMASDFSAPCLVTGHKAPIARLHPKIKGVQNAQSMGASIVSFNLDSFCSYNKIQNFNAPISQDAAFSYTTALNYLLRFGSKQKVQISDATTVFWTERKTIAESIWGEIFNPSSTESSDTQEVYNYLTAVREGKKPLAPDSGIKMYVLGLSPNASRISIRFWMVDTLERFEQNLGKHFLNLRIQKQFPNEKDFPGIWHLLIETLPKKEKLRKSENINPVLAGSFMRSIFTGQRYPQSLLATVITRIRADGDVSYYRTALIKAVLERNHIMEVKMSLDESNQEIAYRLGRLFAVLEKAQEEAIPGANATIKDRFFASASATPGIVFPQLLRGAQHHLSKIGGGSKVVKEKLVQAILEGIMKFPN